MRSLYPGSSNIGARAERCTCARINAAAAPASRDSTQPRISRCSVIVAPMRVVGREVVDADPDAVVEIRELRCARKRASLHTTPNPSVTALVIIDMQRDFLLPGGFGAPLGNDVSTLTDMIEPLRVVLALCAVAVQAGLLGDAQPFGVSPIAPAGADAAGAREITEHGGWRAHRVAVTRTPARPEPVVS